MEVRSAPSTGIPVNWLPSPQVIDLHPGQVHVWKTNLDQVGEMESCLSPDEEMRAARLKSTRKSVNFRKTRSTLRCLLAAYSGQSPRDIRFVYGAKGKPQLQPHVGMPTLEFNLSHSGSLLLAAFSAEAPLGIDIEQIQQISTRENIMRQYFSGDDLAAYKALPAEQQKRAFLSAWTCREACGKADGAGFAFGSNLDFLTPQPAGLSASASIKFNKFGDFWLLPFSPQSGFTAAIAVKSTVQPQAFFFDLSLGENLIGFSSSRGLKMQTNAAISGYMKEAVQHKLEIRHG